MEDFYDRLERRYARTLQRGVFPSRATARAAWAADVFLLNSPPSSFSAADAQRALLRINSRLLCLHPNAAGSRLPQAEEFVPVRFLIARLRDVVRRPSCDRRAQHSYL